MSYDNAGTLVRRAVKALRSTRPSTAAYMQQRRKSRAAYNRAMRMTGMMDDPVGPQIPRGFVGTLGDKKFIDVAGATYACNTTGSITYLNTIPQGTSINTRIGKGCRITSISTRGTIQADTATAYTGYAVYLVWDYQPNRVLASITDVLTSASSIAFPNRENADRFKILKKWYGVISGNSTTPATGLEIEAVDHYLPAPKDANCMWTTADTTGVVGACIQGALLLVTVGNQAAGTGDCNAVLGFRINFTEAMT